MSSVGAPITSHAKGERFAADYARYRGELEERAAALFRSVDEHTREDWCEQAWEALWRHELEHGRDGYDSPMKFLLGVVRDRCTDWLRSPRSATAAVNPLATLWASLEDEDQATERVADLHVSEEEARQVLAALRPGDAKVVVLSVCYGWPVAEVCKELGINRKRYERQLTRGLRTAAKVMARRRGEAWLDAVERLVEQIELEELDQRRLRAALLLEELDAEVHDALVSCGHLAHALGVVAPADLLLRSQGSSLIDKGIGVGEGGLERLKEGVAAIVGRTSPGADAATASVGGGTAAGGAAGGGALAALGGSKLAALCATGAVGAAACTVAGIGPLGLGDKGSDERAVERKGAAVERSAQAKRRPVTATPAPTVYPSQLGNEAPSQVVADAAPSSEAPSADEAPAPAPTEPVPVEEAPASDFSFGAESVSAPAPAPSVSTNTSSSGDGGGGSSGGGSAPQGGDFAFGQ